MVELQRVGSEHSLQSRLVISVLTFMSNIHHFYKLFKASASWPMLSISLFAHMCVCLSVCLCVHFLRYHLNFFFPPHAEVGCLIFLEIRNPWGKIMKRRGLRIKKILLKGVKLPRHFFFFFFFSFCKFRPNKSLIIKSIKSKILGTV